MPAISLSAITNMHSTRAVVLGRFTKELALDERMRSALKTSASAMRIGVIDLKSADGRLFRINQIDVGNSEVRFISELIVGNAYLLPDEFVAALEEKGWTNWIKADLSGF